MHFCDRINVKDYCLIESKVFKMETEVLEEQRTNKMGTMPVRKLLFNMSLPMIISMLAQALYNVVDSIYVARVSQDALDAVGAAFPVQNILIGVGTGTAVGVNALLSRSLGQKDYKRANRVAENGVFLAICASVVFLLFGFFGIDWYVNMGNLTPNVKKLTAEYLQVVCVFSFGCLLQIMLERILQSTGRTVFTLFTQGIGAVINIVLDPVFIFGFGPIEGMGVKGAAVATVIGQIIAGILALVFNIFKNDDIKLSVRSFRPDGRMIGRIYSIGVPSIIMVSIGSFMTYFMQWILNDLDRMGFTVYNIYFKLQSFFFMPIFGLNNGVIPIIAYNYGAENRRRMISTLKNAMVFAVSFMTLGLLAMMIFPDFLLGFMLPKDLSGENLAHFYEVGRRALRTICVNFPVAAVCIVLGSTFQALGKGLNSMIVSAARQLLVLVPVAYLLSLTGNVVNVWWAFPIAEVVSLAVSVFLFVRLYKAMIANIPDGAPVN